METGKGEGSLKIDEEAVEEEEGSSTLGVLFDRKLWGNVQLEKVVKKAQEWVGKVVWMSRVNSHESRKDGVGASKKIEYGVCSRSVVNRRM